MGKGKYLGALGCAVLMGVSLSSSQADARDLTGRILGGVAAGVGAALLGALGARAAQQAPRREARPQRAAARPARGGGESSQRTASAKISDEKVLASMLGPGSRISLPILATFKSGTSLGAVGTDADKDAILKMGSKDDDRDYAKKVTEIVVKFEKKAQNEKTPGDVTRHSIEIALDDAFKSSKLDRFETFLGENWTAERLRVMILNRVLADLDPLFSGNNRGLAPMSSLRSLIQRSADNTYRRLFESSELLAANKSMATFLKRVYEAHGGESAQRGAADESEREKLLDREVRLSAELREAADQMLSLASAQAVARFDGAFRRDANSFALRYRTQRVMFDCLSEHVEEVTASAAGQGIPDVAEIRRRVEQTALNACSEWLVTTFGDARDKVLDQNPMPLRVIWSSSGPKDGPHLYGRASSSL